MISFNKSIKYYKAYREALKVTWYEFVEVTGIHGLRYILDKQGNTFTRTLWLIVTLVGFIASNVLVDTFWLRYKENPTRLKIDSFHKPLNRLQLPAITLCQVNRIDVTRADKFIDQLILPPNVTKHNVLQYLAQGTVFTNSHTYNVNELNVLQNILDENEISMENTFKYIHQPCSDLLFRCRFEYKNRPCEQLFDESLSYLGSCCTFNGKKNFSYTRFFKHQAGLSIVMKPLEDSITYSTTYSKGVKLLVHQSIVYPSDLSVEKMLSHQSENIVRVHTDVTKCSADVKALPYVERDCNFPSEKRLRFFYNYTENNCDVECRMVQINRLCGCLPYNYRVTASSRYPTCNFTKIDCLTSNYFEIHESRLHQQEICSCPPDCNSFSYDVSITKIPLVIGNFTMDSFYDGLNSSHMIAHISFGKQVFKELRRDLLINIIILASGLGGIYSLFIVKGMGVLTFFEIFYFATLRLRANYVRIKNEQVVLQAGTRRILVRAKARANKVTNLKKIPLNNAKRTVLK